MAGAVRLRSTAPVVSTESQLSELVEFYSRQVGFAFDVETQGRDRLDPLANDVAWISLATKGRVDVIPMGHLNGELIEYRAPVLKSGLARLQEGKALRASDVSKADSRMSPVFSPPPEQLSRAVVFDALAPLFFSPTLVKVAHNLKFDAVSIYKYLGDMLVPPIHDTMVVESILDSSMKNQSLSLASCVKRHLKYEMAKVIGRDITQHSFADVARYSALDSKMTWLLCQSQLGLIGARDMGHLVRLEMDTMFAVMEMQMTGTRVDRGAMTVLRGEIQQTLDDARLAAYEIAGREFSFTKSSDKIEVLYADPPVGRGLKPFKFTEKTRTPSTDAESLSHHAGDPLVKQMLIVAEHEKLMSTYLDPYLGTTTRESILRNGRVHTNFNQIGAETGRMSCVSGDTLLRTNRGVYRFDEYVPQQGDTVFTHQGRWMPVLRKIYKGIDDMYLVQSSSGGKITCTAYHRVLTRSGWVRVGDLEVGDIVVHQQEVRERSGEHPAGHREVQGRGQAHSPRSGQGTGNHVSQRHAHPQDSFARGGVQGREGSSLLTFEDRQQEPYAGQEWYPAPQLQGVGVGPQGVPHGAGWQGRAHLPTSPSFPGHGSGAYSRGMACPSHRWGPGEQRSGQPRTGYSGRTPGTAQEEARVVSIDHVGSMGVWDIEVGGDHSYAAGGFLNHNSSQPNLQNIPSRGQYGKRIRGLFIADPGHKLVVGDYSQIEPRIIASLSGDERMIEVYKQGGDLYQAVADDLDITRDAGKQLVLSMAYGVGPETLAERIDGIGVRQAKKLLDDFSKKFPKVEQLKRKTIQAAVNRKPRPYVTTVLARRRYIPELMRRETRARGERQAFNTRIQGSAAEIMKIALVRVFSEIPDEARMLMTVHDEVVVQAPDHLVEDTVRIVKEQMESVSIPSITVPMVADVGSGASWGEAK